MKGAVGTSIMIFFEHREFQLRYERINARNYGINTTPDDDDGR